MRKAKIVIRITAVVLLLSFYIFIFAYSKSIGGLRFNGKLISQDGNNLVMEVMFSEREIEVSNPYEYKLVEGQWYKVSHRQVTWGYEPLMITTESTYSITGYYDYESGEVSQNIQENTDPVAEYVDELFKISLHSLKDVYSIEEEVLIYGTIEYVGEEDSISIWHGVPFMNFSVKGEEKEFIVPIELPVLKNSTLSKGEEHSFNMMKTGGYYPEMDDYEFWKSFFDEERMLFPEGVYEVRFSTSFSLDGDVEYSANVIYSFNVYG